MLSNPICFASASWMLTLSLDFLDPCDASLETCECRAAPLGARCAGGGRLSREALELCRADGMLMRPLRESRALGLRSP
jgi:hypothetical protein